MYACCNKNDIELHYNETRLNRTSWMSTMFVRKGQVFHLHRYVYQTYPTKCDVLFRQFPCF